MQCARQWLPILMVLLMGPNGSTVPDAAELQPRSVQSPPHLVALLEIYTSEGCNSCPPVDDWVNTLSARGFRPDQVIPLAFHVDYWDNLGWPDRFGQAEFSQRQRAIASRHRSSTVYTPQLVLQSQDFRGQSSFRHAVSQINRTKAQADITLGVTPQSAALAVTVRALVREPAAPQHAVMYIALYENNLSTDVTAGENRGRRLHHNFVVRRWIGPLSLDPQGMIDVQRELPLPQDRKPQDLGVAVGVFNPQTGDVLQAVAIALGPENQTK
jgi:hypothetical protein